MVAKVVKEWQRVKVPKMVLVKQKFKNERIENIDCEIRKQFYELKLEERMKPNSKIAVAVGSRGINNIALITKSIVNLLKENNFQPFIIPAMGSHAGATSEGQKRFLSGYGITEEYVGVPIVSSMDVVKIGEAKVKSLKEDVPVYIDKNAYEADGIIFINRVKPHTLFRSDIESGLLKMLAIGLGKHKGCSTVHNQGFDMFGDVIPAVGNEIIKNAPIYFGVGIVENSYDETAIIKIAPKEKIYETDKELLIQAKSLIGKLLVPECNVLVIGKMGKEYSGDGIDPNVTGRYANPDIKPDLKIQRVVVLDITNKTDGNACGVGASDIITKKLFDKINFEKTYINVFTATAFPNGKIPLVIDSEEECLQVALSSCVRIYDNKYKLVFIPNTLKLEKLWVSEDVIEDIKNSPYFEMLSRAAEIEFDHSGKIINLPF